MTRQFIIYYLMYAKWHWYKLLQFGSRFRGLTKRMYVLFNWLNIKITNFFIGRISSPHSPSQVYTELKTQGYLRCGPMTLSISPSHLLLLVIKPLWLTPKLLPNRVAKILIKWHMRLMAFLLIFQYLFLSFKAVLTDFFLQKQPSDSILIFKLRIQTLLETYEFNPEFPRRYFFPL